MKKVLFHLLLLFISAGAVRALEPPVGARITSDYGPRNVTRLWRRYVDACGSR